jgi:hypothetical protein
MAVTSIPLLSTIRRGGSKEGVVFSGVFLLDCSLENSVIAGRNFCRSIYYSYPFPLKYNFSHSKTFPFYNLHYFRDFTYRSDRMDTLLEMQRKFYILICCLYDTRCTLNPVRNDLAVCFRYFCHILDILKHKYHFTVFIHVFSMFIGQSCLSGVIGFVGYAYIGDPK